MLTVVFLVFVTFAQFSGNHVLRGVFFNLLSYVSLSSKTNLYLYRPYTFIAYSFVHLNFIHFISNVLVLYYVGNLFLDFFTKKQFLIYFIFGSIFGGLFFITLNYLTPNSGENILIGASASITALLVGVATKVPSYTMRFRFIGYVKLYIVALVWIVLSFILMTGNNIGGQVAHLGGAFIGFILTKYYYASSTQNFTFAKKKKTNLKTVFKKSDYGLSNYQKDRLHQQKVDYLLDKISKSGYNSLSQAERDFLSRASKK